MKKLTEREIAACKALGENAADEDVDSFIAFANRNRQRSSEETIGLIFDDWTSFAEQATGILVGKGFIDRPYGYGYGHERLLAFKLFTEAYERKITTLIKDRCKVYLQVPFQENDTVKALGGKWDATCKKWYVPKGLDAGPFAKWVEPPSSPLAATAREETRVDGYRERWSRNGSK